MNGLSPAAESAEFAELAAQRVGRLLVDKWRLERVLGSGGMATVYAATHRNNGRAVAIKLLHPELAANDEIRKRFAREGYIANKVGHPAAVAMLDDGVDEDGSVFLVMDLLVGQSLHDRQKSAPGGVLSEEEALFIADSVLDVLASAHDQGIVHRDLKPDNVFLTTDGAVRVLDFGIARLLDVPTGEKATQTGLLIGTPAYMPPEQARGRSKEVDARSDLWAMGAILFTLLTGRRVHDAETPNEMLLMAMTAHAPPLTSILPGASEALASVVDRALSFEPDARWPDARAMQSAVRDARATATPLRKSAVSGGRAPLPTPVTSMPMVSDVVRPRSSAGRVVIGVVAIAACGLAASLLAPAKWRRVSDTVATIAPVITRAEGPGAAARDAGAPQLTSASADVTSSAKSDPRPLRRPPPPRPKSPVRSKAR